MERLKPNVLVLKADGTNCEQETAEGFKLGGGKPEIVMINQLKEKERSLLDYKILALPGGFAYGDDLGAGKVLALELDAYLRDQIYEFNQRRGGLVIGICNGFQVLVRTGLLPFGNMGEMKSTLTFNESGKFECRRINLKIEPESKCIFLNYRNTSDGGRLILSEVEGEAMTPPRWTNNGILSFQVAHGEGRFYAPSETIDSIEKQRLVVFRYCDLAGNSTQQYPDNPNDSMNAIAGICDPTGRILGLMPHPERSIKKTQYDNWRRMGDFKPEGLQIFEKMVTYAAQM